MDISWCSEQSGCVSCGWISEIDTIHPFERELFVAVGISTLDSLADGDSGPAVSKSLKTQTGGGLRAAPSL